MAGKFEKKVALVTGAASGIGRAAAILFAREGARVVIADIAVEGGEETVQMIKDTGSEAIFVKADVSKSAEVEALINKTVNVYGRLDCAHNNAGGSAHIAPITDLTEEFWDEVMDVNLKGVWLCMKYEIPQMLKQGSGAIVNTASVGGLIGTAGISPYTAAKHGVVGLTKAVALEYARANIRVNAVCPSAILTPPAEAFMATDPKIADSLEKMHPIGRIGKPEEIADAVIWLCSDAAAFVTGGAFPIDGGLLAGAVLPQ